MSGHMQNKIAIHCSALFNCKVATNRATLESPRDGRQYLVIGFIWPFILHAPQHFDTFESSVHYFLFRSRLTYLSGFMEATTAWKSTHCSTSLNSSSCNQQVDSWASMRWLDISFSIMAEWSAPSHHFFVSYLLAASDYCFDMGKQKEEILDQFSVCSYGKE